MREHVVKRGLDVPIAGPATGDPVPLDPPRTVAVAPTELRGILPRLAAREGDRVEAGQPLFFSKAHPEMVFRSPAAGRVAEVRRGKRRVITDIVVELEGDGVAALPTHTMASLRDITRQAALEALVGSGYWFTLRTRPLDRVADPAVCPQAVLIAGTDTGPLQPGAAELLDAADAEPIQAAIHALRALTDGPVYLSHGPGPAHPALAELEGVEHHRFTGPHPSGDPAVQINLIDPPRGSNQVWYLRAWDAAAIGRTLLEGRFAAERVYAAVGAGVARPRLVRTLLGAPLADLAGEVRDGPMRWIRGSILTGEAVAPDRWAGFLTRAVHLLPEEVPRAILGWALPLPGVWSFHRAFLSGFTRPARRYDLRPGVFGGVRAMVPVGYYRDVVATPDILPEFLFRSIASGDLAESMALGLLDISAEEAALCTYICPSKIEFGALLRQGLERYEAEV